MKFRIIDIYEFDSNDYLDDVSCLIPIEDLKKQIEDDPYSFIEGCEPKETKVEFDE